MRAFATCCTWLLLSLSLSHAAKTKKGAFWRFIVLADWHGAKPFVITPVKSKQAFGRNDDAVRKARTFRYIKDNYGGELVVLPGDSNAGKWYKKEFLKILNVTTAEAAVKKAGQRCYQSMKHVFREAGYNRLLMAVGDHELGGNSWPIKELKTGLLPDFRKTFYGEFNKDAKGKPTYRDPIGKADSRPFNTTYETTSYAYRHKNVLFVTVDVFRSMPSDFIDKEKGLGGEGSVTCDVTGKHLKWFREVLSEARKDATIKHIFVQGHPPILQPVRKIRCTGQFMDGAENSDFFQAMRDYNVDVYFSGDVHANTVTKDDKSNLVQVVSRGNGAQNFLAVDVSDEIIRIDQFNEIGPKPRRNDNYEFYGQVVIDKSGVRSSYESGGSTQELPTYNYQSSGSLKILDRQKPMIHLSFDKTVPLSQRPVLAMAHDDIDKTLKQRKITIQGVQCWNSFPNTGEFGQQYDAQTANVGLYKGVQGKAAGFNSTSRVAIFAMGPHVAGLKVSYALWFNTKVSKRNQVLLHFGEFFVFTEFTKNQIFTLTLDKGLPALYAGTDMKLEPVKKSIKLSNAKWQHLAISMPRNSCRLSEVEMFINGERVETEVKGKDDYLFFTTSGTMSVGGFGHSDRKTYQKLLPSHESYTGLIDEVYVFSDSLSQGQVAVLAEKPLTKFKTAGAGSTTQSQTTPSPTGAPTRVSPTSFPSSSPSLEPSTSISPSSVPSEIPSPSPSNDPFTEHSDYRCEGKYFYRTEAGPEDCRTRCLTSEINICMGYEARLNQDGIYICKVFYVTPEIGDKKLNSDCFVRTM